MVSRKVTRLYNNSGDLVTGSTVIAYINGETPGSHPSGSWNFTEIGSTGLYQCASIEDGYYDFYIDGSLYTPNTNRHLSGAMGRRYIWKKVQLSDTLSEQTLTTGSGLLTLVNLDSGQSYLPTFSGTVKALIGSAYQDRKAYISTDASVSVGNVTFGVKLSGAGPSGTPYFDIIVEQL